MGEAQLQIEHYWAGALRRAVIDGDVEHGSVMAGQSVGMVTREEPVTEIIDTLMAEAAAALAKRQAGEDVSKIAKGRHPCRPRTAPPPAQPLRLSSVCSREAASTTSNTPKHTYN